jgi:hypothetical protein
MAGNILPLVQWRGPGGLVMFLVRGSVTALAAQVAGKRLIPRLLEQFRFRFGYSPFQQPPQSDETFRS